MKNRSQLSFWLITIAAVIGLIVPVLVRDGMFMDGVQYACISRNMANGVGSFWQPYLSATWNKNGSAFFLEHPPLVYGIQSLFFKFLGNSMFVERLYSFITAVLTTLLIVAMWRLVFGKSNHDKDYSWFAVLLWISVPVCFWCYQNNMQENTMGIFTLASVFLVLKGLNSGREWIFIPASAALIFLAVLSKGLPGLFPLATILIYWLVYRNISFRKALCLSGLQLLIVILLFSVLFLNREAAESLKFYFFHRLLYRVQEEPTVTGHFFILKRLITELIPVFIISFIFWLMNRKRRVITNQKLFLFFLMMGFSASIPLAITKVQSGFYLLPAFPFFALAFAATTIDNVKAIINKLDDKKWFHYAAMGLLLLMIGYSITNFGKPGRDKELISDIYLVGKELKNNQIVGIDPEISDLWSLQMYFLRYYNISFYIGSLKCEYYIQSTGNKKNNYENFVYLPLNTQKLCVFKNIGVR